MRRRDFLCSLGTVPLLSLCAPSGVAQDAGAEDGASGAREAATFAPYYWSWWGWEPLDHYRRLGRNAGAVDGSAAWVPQWYDRLHSDQLVRTMADLGVNLAITHFFKGFGLKHERDQQQRTADLVRIAHRHGVRVLGYCQSRSLYYEAFLADQPDAESWIQRDQTGQLRTWGGTYFRWTPCIQSSEFRQYLKGVIRFGLEEIGLDGLHFDNDYAEPCYCQRCEKKFREWLSAHHRSPRERFGLESLEHVRQPPTQTLTQIQDPLVQEWVRFRCEGLGEYHRDITSHARSIRPAAILMGNPAHPRSFDAPYRRSVWAPAVGRHLNLMFAENGNFPGIDDGAVISQIRAYKQARAIGYRVVSTTWRKGKETALGLPEKLEEICLQVAEAAANGGVPGTNWSLRPLGEGDRMRIDRPEFRDALGKSLGFVRSHAALTDTTCPVRDVAVLQTFASLAFDSQGSWSRLLGAEEVLIRGGFAWETVFGDDLGRWKEHAVLLIAGQSHLSDRECEAVRGFVDEGGILVLGGENGQMDENGRLRGSGGLAGLAGQRVVRMEDEAVRSAATAGHEVRVPLPKNWQKLAAAIETAAGDRLSVRLRGSDVVAVSAYHRKGDGLVVHLVNYATPKTQQGVRLELGPRWKNANTARWLPLGGAEQELRIADQAGRRVVELPAIETYAIVVA
ncbi:MAG: beta-galactosidase [Pirellulales bacterium]|nr:beta-galactosidase [Pirellulales bacterium]